MKHIVIIGNGISGITAARHIRKRSGYAITVISSENEYFFSRTALMYVYMGHMKFENIKPYENWFWKKNRIDLVFDHVSRMDAAGKNLILKSGKKISYDTLIIATGSKSNILNKQHEYIRGVQGLYSYSDLQKMEAHTKKIGHAVIVGGGLIGVEMAEMLRSRKIPVTMIVREPEFWSNVLPLQDARLIGRHIRSHQINFKLNSQVQEILVDDTGAVKGVVTDKNETIACEFIGITIGVSPNIEFLNGSGIATNRGVLVNEYLETNITDVYAIGDCVERTYSLPGRNNIEQVWYTGRMMGEVVAQTICNEPTKYEPGPWFNSAKFFDIEYQTYGLVENELPSTKTSFYWEHPKVDKAVHVTWQKQNDEFCGINAFGIRYRHELFDRWLREKRDIHFVMNNLHHANFDPEFTTRNENDILRKFNKQSSLKEKV